MQVRAHTAPFAAATGIAGVNFGTVSAVDWHTDLSLEVEEGAIRIRGAISISWSVPFQSFQWLQRF
jgi:hypothetical protein